MKLTGIVLASGGGQRFGGDKRRIILPNGDTLLLHSVRQLCRILDDVLVVLRPDDQDLEDTLQSMPCRTCYNPNPERGMGWTLSRGVQASADAEGWLILPADLPLLRPVTIQEVAMRLLTADAVVPICHGRRGHPVGFSARFRGRLSKLSGDQGGKQILQDAPEEVVRLNVQDPGIYWDIDRPEDLSAMWTQIQMQLVGDGIRLENTSNL